MCLDDVYLVFRYDSDEHTYASQELLGVFSSEEDAKRFIKVVDDGLKAKNGNRPRRPLVMLDFEVWVLRDLSRMTDEQLVEDTANLLDYLGS